MTNATTLSDEVGDNDSLLTGVSKLFIFQQCFYDVRYYTDEMSITYMETFRRTQLKVSPNWAALSTRRKISEKIST